MTMETATTTPPPLSSSSSSLNNETTMTMGTTTTTPPPLSSSSLSSPLSSSLIDEFGWTDEEVKRLRKLAELVEQKRATAALVSRSSLDDIWRRHIADSAQLVSLLPADENAQPSLADLGSGAGFPGLVIAILRPKWQVHLVEANEKKSAFLRMAAETCGVNAEVHRARAESLPSLNADIITARAVAPVARLLELGARHLSPDGRCLFHQGRRSRAEAVKIAQASGWHCTAHESRTEHGSAILELKR